ncbi:hypothetical protein FIBSPDRAFT_984248 [Athelia psychrophila]|uniref:HAM1-like N-terminal domain-containing protein n=1 Tax=Athelia psychrophila TaxID=1759441 RepID=A0A166BPJ0_9AGAM|nr:hypothetical protein FIBSPDRAFT_984248 [Fibularhizoctonia sp. CBS 109695]
MYEPQANRCSKLNGDAICADDSSADNQKASYCDNDNTVKEREDAACQSQRGVDPGGGTFFKTRSPYPLPNVASLEAHNFVKFSPYAAIQDEHHYEFTLTFAQMWADMWDIALYFRKKTGISKLSDSGLADVVLGGEGLTATVHLVSSTKDKPSVFKVKNGVVKVDTLNFSICDSKQRSRSRRPSRRGWSTSTDSSWACGTGKIRRGRPRAQVLQDIRQTFAQKKEEVSATGVDGLREELTVQGRGQQAQLDPVDERAKVNDNLYSSRHEGVDDSENKGVPAFL